MASTPLKILQTCFSRSWGGLELQAFEITRHLRDRGHHVWLACCPGSRLERESRAAGIRTLPLNVTGYFHPRIAWRLGRFIAAETIDVIHCQLSQDIATVVPAVRLSLKRVPLLLSKRVGSYVNKKDPLHRFTYAGVSKVLAVSSVIHRNVLDTTPMDPANVITLFDAVDTGEFSPANADGRAFRESHGLGDGTVVIGFVGRFSPGKGHEELLAAADIMRKKRSNVHFVVVGEASYGEQLYEQRIRGLSHSLGLDALVTFTGFRKDIPQVMASFDILAFPSHAESFGLVLIEAMAMEKPVVSTNCDGVLDIVVHEETGLYVQPRNAADLANALIRLVDDAAMREQMGKAGRRRVLERFDQQRQIDELEHIYHQALRDVSHARPGSARATGLKSSAPPAK